MWPERGRKEKGRRCGHTGGGKAMSAAGHRKLAVDDRKCCMFTLISSGASGPLHEVMCSLSVERLDWGVPFKR